MVNFLILNLIYYLLIYFSYFILLSAIVFILTYVVYSYFYSDKRDKIPKLFKTPRKVFIIVITLTILGNVIYWTDSTIVKEIVKENGERYIEQMR